MVGQAIVMVVSKFKATSSRLPEGFIAHTGLVSHHPAGCMVGQAIVRVVSKSKVSSRLP